MAGVPTTPITITEQGMSATFPTAYEAACWLMAYRLTHDDVKRLRNQTRVHLQRNHVLLGDGLTIAQLDSHMDD
jgi:putative hemolysin